MPNQKILLLKKKNTQFESLIKENIFR